MFVNNHATSHECVEHDWVYHWQIFNLFHINIFDVFVFASTGDARCIRFCPAGI